MTKKSFPKTVAFCADHGFFLDRQTRIEEGERLVIHKDIDTECPTCGQSSQVIPGIYSHTDDGPQFSLYPEFEDRLKEMGKRAVEIKTAR